VAANGPYGLTINTADAVMVSTLGNDLTGTGTPRFPFRTIGKGILVAQTTGQDVYVAAGEYRESVVARPEVTVIGGFDPTTWALSTARTTILAGPGTRQAVLADGAAGVVLARLTLEGPTGRSDFGGVANSYGLRAVRGSSVVLLDVVANGGAAAAGVSGSTPTGDLRAGDPGAKGGTPRTNACRSVVEGGAGGSPRGARGGAGGGFTAANNPTNGNAGEPGAPNSTGGAGGEAGSAQSGGNPSESANGKPGGAGATGDPGGNGTHAKDVENHSADRADWAGAAAAAGDPGGFGRGGGGGGGGGARMRDGFLSNLRIAGNSGGGGGGGGQGGGGGGAGQSGGASFGVFLQGSTLVAVDSTLRGGKGGAGGAGGDGQFGAPGGAGGTVGDSVDPGCGLGSAHGGNGGPGGSGGRGGGGGGGAGGPSAAIYDGEGSRFALLSSSLTTGQAGAGGDGGLGGARATGGVSGKAGQTFNSSSSDARVDVDRDAVVDVNDRCPTVSGGSTDLLRNGCPGSELSVSIEGPARVDMGVATIFKANVKDSLGQPAAYTWSIAGRQVGSDSTLTHTFTAPGATTLAVRVVNDVGNAIDANLVVEVIDPRAVDGDGDGYPLSADCDDGNRAIHPNAPSIVDNGVDEDCDGSDPPNLDRDRDGYQRPLDCDDGNPAVHPGAAEKPGNAVDENCDRVVLPWPRLTGVKVAWASEYFTKHTLLRRLVLQGAPRRAKVTVTCSGGGCPRKALKLTATGRDIKLSRFTKRKLRVGARITAHVRYPGYVSSVFVMSIRSKRLPLTRALCQAPDERRPSACL
jgi:hypothetical protein